MPKGSPTSSDQVRQAASLRAQGKTTAQISIEMSVVERTVYKLLAKAKTSGDLKDYEPWSLLTAMEHGEPVEKLKWLFAADVEWGDGRDASRRETEWAWLIHTVRPDLPARFVLSLTAYYLVAEQSLRLKWTARVLDRALRHSPWESQQAALLFYSRAVQYAPAQAYPDRATDLAILADVDIGLRRFWRLETKSADALVPSTIVIPNNLIPERRAEILGLTNLRIQDDNRSLGVVVSSPIDEALSSLLFRRSDLPWEAQVSAAIQEADKVLKRKVIGGKS